ncbi:MAG TPA: amino acid adenylation domain-containing protein [Pyrinomonadaceae bacterium]
MNNNIESVYPLAPMQQGLLFHALYAPGTISYFQQVDCVLRGSLDVDVFKQAWQRVAARHAALRTGFVWENLKEPVQVVYRDAELPLEFYESDSGTEWWDNLLRRERVRGFDLSAAPLMRLMLARVDESAHRFAINYHHIILDGWSLPLLLREVFAYYASLSEGRDLTLDQPPPFRDYIAWLRQQDRSAAEPFWRRTLAGFTSPTTLSRKRISGYQQAAEPQFAETQITIAPETIDGLRGLAPANRLTLSTLLYAAWALLNSHYTGETDVVFGVTVSGRMINLPGVESIVGLLVNTVPLRVRVEMENSLLEWLKEIQAQQLEARQFDSTPLVDIQNCSEIPRGQLLFESILVFENYPSEGLQEVLGDLSIAQIRTFERTTYPLTLLIGSRPFGSLRLIYDTRLFSSETIKSLLGHLNRLLEGFAFDPERKLSAIPMLTAAEQFQLLIEWNDTTKSVEPAGCIHDLFEAQAEQTPDAVAVIDGEHYLSYAALNERADAVASRLRASGAGPETVVGVCLERSLKMVVALLGILKSGAAYLPLDPAYPRERFNFMLDDSGAVLLLTEPSLASFAAPALPVIHLNGECARVPRKENFQRAVRGHNLAYVIYTSGSTGTPKGTAIEHRQTVAFLNWAATAFTREQREKILASTSVCFDLSIFELFFPLSCGATVVMAQTGLSLSQLPAASTVTLINTVPSVLAQLLKLGPLPASVRTVNLAGEPLKRQLVEQAYARPGIADVYNLYGPSEDTTYSTVARLRRNEGDTPSIGRPISGTRTYLLNRAGLPVPVGVNGELYLGGDGLARGYLNRPDLTAERFVPDSLSGLAGQRLYKTGDLGRWRANGEIEFLGRMDHQVKLRGFRIELREIEITLNQHPSVLDAAAAVRKNEAGEKYLVGYVMVRNGDAVTGDQLREFLQVKLPAYMVPSVFMVMDQLPLTPNGKLDRKKLPAPGEEFQRAAQVYVAPRTEVEHSIAAVWQDVLRVSKVGVHDNFFDIGGHSLLLLAAYVRLKPNFNHDLSIVELFKYPTIASLAEFLRRGQSEQSTVQPQYAQAQSRRELLKRQRDFRGKHRA